MIQPVALQQSPLEDDFQPRQARHKQSRRTVRRRTDETVERPRNSQPPNPSNLSPRLGRLIGEGDEPARKVWRLRMEATDVAIQPARLAGALRLWSAARALLALLGLAVILAVALPAPREALLRQYAAWSEALEDQASNITAGTIQVGAADPALRDQRAVTEFIAKRYRVAQDAAAGFVATAYRAGGEWKVDPLLILAVVAIESRYNPVAESNMGAKGLMQVIPKFHPEKLVEHGGESALLDPHVNIQVGAQILREYMRRFGETETALQMYAGAFDEPNSQYAFKVLAERARLEQLLKQLKQLKRAATSA
jgi:soluble lytic murein transglycosylase-like protein